MTVTVGKIPVRNLWLLMLYASSMFDDVLRGTPPVKRQHYEDNPEKIFELIAEILTGAVERRLRRNLTVDLARRQDILTRVRGRIDHIQTEGHRLLQRGMIACTFDEFTTDTTQNRLVKQALDCLSQMYGLKSTWRQRCRADSWALEKASVGSKNSSEPTRSDRTALRVVRNPEDRRMIAAAELALYMRIPAEDKGLVHFDALDRTKQEWIRDLFEKAVAGFYHSKFPAWTVRHGGRLKWQIDDHSDGIDSILPGMKTDITIEREESQHSGKMSRTIIDTKFAEITTASEYRNILKNGHIYQMYAYLRSQEDKDDEMTLTSSGMLLYPAVDENVDEWFVTHGHMIRFATVNLSADSKDIRDRLIALFEEWPPSNNR